MARKNTMKNDNNTITFDTKNKSVMADVGQHDNVKEKVSAVREVVQGRSNNEIILVLQYYDYDVEKAIQAYVEDGAKLALTEWRYSGTKPVKKKKNKKKATAEQKEAPLSPESASSESGSAGSFMVNGHVKEPVVNGVLEDHLDILKTKNNNNNNNNNKLLLPNGPTSVSSVTVATLVATDTLAASSNGLDPVIPGSAAPSSSGMKGVAGEGVKEKSPSPQPQPQPQRQPHARHGKQRTHSGSHGSHHDNRTRTTSTSSVGDGTPAKKHASVHHGMERSAKDLHRQTVSLERLRLVFNEEVDKSYKRIKSVFDEFRTCLIARENQLLSEMNSARDAGRDMFIMRQGLAADLKVKIDRADKMSESELAELRSEIKHFVSERKMDEDLGRSTRFFYDNDLLIRDIKAFGEVIPVKCTYSNRRGSVSSAVSDDHPLPGQVVSSNNVTGGKKESIRQSSPGKVDRPPASSSSSIAPSSGAATAPQEGDKKGPSLPHMAPDEAHEVAELQKRLKHSLTLEGIAVETYQERPESAPAATTNTTETSPSKPPRDRRNNNRNRRRGDNRDNRDRRDRPPRGEADNRVSSFSQNSSGERVILIGRNTRPQTGPPRPRGAGAGRGRGGQGGGGRGRGAGNSYSGPRNNQDSIAAAGDTSTSSNNPGGQMGLAEKRQGGDRPKREGSGSPRKGRGGSGGGGGEGNRGSGGRGRGSPQNRNPAPPPTGGDSIKN